MKTESEKNGLSESEQKSTEEAKKEDETRYKFGSMSLEIKDAGLTTQP